MLFRLTEELRKELKEPLGKLIRGPIPEPYFQIKEKIRGKTIITVGDVVTENLLKLGISPSLAIYDLKTKRVEYSPDINAKAVFITVSNPPGTITKALLEAIKRAFNIIERKKSVHILVNGEEDLAAIPAVLYAPYGSIVLYGQPDEGIVFIKVTPKCKRRCARILSRMEVVRNGN